MAGKPSSPTPVPVTRAIADMGDQFTTWRKLRGLTAAQVAERAGISRGTLLRLESGQGSVSLENVLRVARALGVLKSLAGALDPYATDIGRLRSAEALPQRVRSRKYGASGND